MSNDGSVFYMCVSRDGAESPQREGVANFPSTLPTGMVDKIVAINGLESKELILLNLSIVDLGRSVWSGGI